MGNLFRSAIRNIKNRKFYSLVGLTSLSIGLTVSLLIFSFVRYEQGFDAMHQNAERTYRMNWVTGEGARFATFFNPLSPVFESALPEIEETTRLGISQELFTIDGENQYEMLSMVDDTFFDFFTYQSIHGDARDAIADMNSAVITESAALELFGSTSSLGRTFTINGTHDFIVGAVVNDNPANSHLVSNIYINLENITTVWNAPQFWENTGSDVLYHYARIQSGVDYRLVEENANSFYQENIAQGSANRVVFQPMLDIHFTTDLQNEMSLRDDITGMVKGQRQRSDIYIFIGVAVLTLFIAAFNFMNLQTVQLGRRLKEVGIRRIAGASPNQLAGLFLVETAIISATAFVLSIALSVALLPGFNTMLGVGIEDSAFLSVGSVSFLFMVAMTVGLLAGLYPAITAANTSPISVLRRGNLKQSGASQFRSSLIIAQFSISIGLMVAAGIVNNQINYAMTKSLGFVPDNVVTIDLPNSGARQSYPLMRDQISQLPGVISVSAGSVVPTQDLSDGRAWNVAGGISNEPLATRWVRVDDNYFESLGMQIIAGRAFSPDFPADRTEPWSATVTSNSGGVILNEAAVQQGGWSSPADAIGYQFLSEGPFRGVTYRNESTIVGVVSDAHFQSIRADIVPISFSLEPGIDTMIVKLAEGSHNATLGEIDNIWNLQVPEFPIQRVYLEDSYTAFYAGENRTFILFISLSVVAVMIACLGLYALVAYLAERRTKEVSIRRVLGATVANIATLLVWDFSRLVVLANIVAWPLAWWSMQQWLENFAYRTDITIGIFLLAGMATFLLALVTIFHKTYSVASVKPVTALRTE